MSSSGRCGRWPGRR